MNNKVYHKVGQMIAYFIVHRGPLPSFFKPIMFDILVNGIDNVPVSSEDIIDYDVKERINQVSFESSYILQGV